MPAQLIPGADLSPVQMLRALRDQPGLVALFGDWHDGDALIGFRPLEVLGEQEDPFAALDSVPASLGEAAPAESPGAFGGGWIGYLGYQLARRLERLPPAPPRPARLPDHHLGFYDHVLCRRAATGQWFLESLSGADPARTATARDIVRAALSGSGEPADYRCELFRADVSAAEHAAAVTAALGRIRDGDIFQANT